MLTQVITGAVIMFVGVTAGWIACNKTHRRYEACEAPVSKSIFKQL